LLVMDRVIAAAAEAGLTVMVKASMDARPAWGPTDDDAAGFLDYLRRRALLHPVVLTVDVMTLNDAKPAELIAVGTEPGAVSPRLARLRLWTAIAQGARSVGFVGDGHLLTRALLAVGETAGVVTRNQALFGPLRPIDPATGYVTVTGGNGRVEVRILESSDALVIVGLNQSDRVQKVTMTFSPGIPDATWQSIEDGVGVNIVAGNVGPWFAHTFAPHDALVLTIRKKLRGSAPADLKARFAAIAPAAMGKVGAAVMLLETGETATLNGEGRHPMQSVYKLPIGMAVLHKVDLGELSLEQRVKVARFDMVPAGQYSPIRDQFPQGTELTIRQLLSFTLAQSDGTGSDVLLRLAGGPSKVMRFLASIGVRDVQVVTTEKAMGLGDDAVQYRNWATPRGLLSVLDAVHKGRGLSPSSRTLLLEWMTQVDRGEGRIKGQLPPGTLAARRTGSSGSRNGLTAATNDTGIVTLPDGRHLAIVVFVSDSRADNPTRERVIAEIARAAWDRFTK
ncbi:MAG TPA: class A beta-lactamase, partial [Plantibacter sp.]|uniref:class A beta-lactamase n=1 Tax=Plantibacter sp. TaxID=1871045 RepID=UPI002D02010A|nr:class A beta-lactamase [Plantibacter sp.]